MKRRAKTILVVSAIALAIIAIAAAIFITDKMSTEHFLNDFNTMNGHYKQALFQTGQGNREVAQTEYDAFVSALTAFRARYEASRPNKLKGDAAFNDDLRRAQDIAAQASADVKTGNLSMAHTTLEGVRPIFNELLRRNDLSLLSVALVDFHDSMEQVMEAGNAKDSALVLERYTDADSKLKNVETELNDSGVQAIRKQLDTMRDLAVADDTAALPAQSGTLKTSYVKVYLAQG